MIALATKFYEYLGSLLPFLSTFQWRFYQHLVENETTLMRLSPAHRILFIGGGATPISAELYHKQTGVMVDVIDHDRRMVAAAKRYIKKRSCETIRIRHCALCDADFTGYTHVIIAKQVTLNETGFHSVLTRVDTGTMVLIRKSGDTLNGFARTKKTEVHVA